MSQPDGVEGLNPPFVAMDDGVRLRFWAAGKVSAEASALVLVHGGPGLPHYLEPVADAVSDMGRVFCYDPRGTGESPWNGEHTIARQVCDLELLLNAWGQHRAVLIGHSFGCDLVSFFLLAHPDRVAGIIYLSGPFLGSWREPTRATERSRLTQEQQAHVDELEAAPLRSDTEEEEFLTLSWFTDHADRQLAWDWASHAAHVRRPVNYEMNKQLNADKRVEPLESQLERLRTVLPPDTVIIGGEGDPRPARFLRGLAERLDCDVIIIPGAGHEPWLERPAEFRVALRSAVTANMDRLTVQ